MMLATSTATKRKTEASVTEGPTVVDTSESVRCKLFLQNFARLVDAVRPVVVKFAVNALSKSLISEYNKCDAENPAVSEFNRASVLMSQITPKIKESDAHFDAFVAILQELNITKLACELKKAVDPTIKLPVTASRTREGSDSGSGSGAESVDATGFKCPCGQCSLEKYFRDRSKCSGLQETAFPFLNTSHVSRDERESLEHHLIADTNRIRGEFKKLSDAIFKALERNETPVSKIRSTVFSSAKAGRSRTIQTVHCDELKTITTIFDLNSFLICYDYFINYGILEALIEEHCKECQTDLDSYLQKFKEFSRRNVFEVPSDIFTSSSTPDNLLVVKVIDEIWFGGERDAPDCHFTLRDIKSVQNKIAEVIEHDRHFIRLIDIGKGCIQLAFEVLSCPEPPIFPLSTSQLSELIRCGIIVLYQPNVPSLPTNIQDTDCQTHDIQFTVADDTETPPTIPSADETKTPPNIPSDGDSETPPIPSFKTPPTVPSTIKPIPPVTRTFLSQFTDDDSRSMISADSGSTSTLGSSSANSLAGFSPSSSVKLQEPGVSKRRYEGLPLGELKRRIAYRKSRIEEWKGVKADYQLYQRKAEERVRDLQSRLAQTANKDYQRELEWNIHDEEERIKSYKEKVQQWEEEINEAEADILALTETKDKATESKRLLGEGRTSPSLQTDTSRLKTVPSSEQSPLQTLSRKKELPLAKEELEKRIAEKKGVIEKWKKEQAFWQMKSDKEVRDLQWRLAQTTYKDYQRELEWNIHHEEVRIKEWKEKVQQWEKWINEAESELLALTETKDKESKRLLGEGRTSPSLQTDTSRLKTVQSSEQSPLQTLSRKKELPLRMEELERRIAGKKGVIEKWKEEQAFWQQEQRKSEKRVRGLQSRLAQTTDEDDQRELEWNINDEEERIKSYKEKVQQCEERINKTETDILALAETKNKEFKRLLGEETSMTSPSIPPSYQPLTAAAVKPTVPSSGYSEHQTSIELPPTLETKVDTVTLEDDV